MTCSMRSLMLSSPSAVRAYMTSQSVALRGSSVGIPQSMFTVLFAMGRLPGWIAHYLEWRHDPYLKIGRPRQIYAGPEEREVVPIAER